MYQFAIYFVIYTVPFVDSLDDSTIPYFLRFKNYTFDITCGRVAPFDHRCNRVDIDFQALEKVEIMMFDLGLLRLYLHHHRTYVFGEYAMTDFMGSYLLKLKSRRF